jgi:Spy/CpxP family protein refolding chaperone
MRRTHKIVAAGCAALAIAGIGAGLASAGPMGPGFGPMAAGPGTYAPGARFARGNPAAFADAHLADLKSALKITSEQEPAWDAFAGKVKAQAEAMQALRAKAWEATGAAPDRMAQHAEFMKQRVAAMEGAAEAMKALYAVLTPEQKATLDQGFGPGGGRGPGMPFGPRAW